MVPVTSRNKNSSLGDFSGKFSESFPALGLNPRASFEGVKHQAHQAGAPGYIPAHHGPSAFPIARPSAAGVRPALSSYSRLAFWIGHMAVEKDVKLTSHFWEVPNHSEHTALVAPTTDPHTVLVWGCDIQGNVNAVPWRLQDPDSPPSPSNVLVANSAWAYDMTRATHAIHISHNRAGTTMETMDAATILKCYQEGTQILPVVPLDPSLRYCGPFGIDLVLVWQIAATPNPRAPYDQLFAVPWLDFKGKYDSRNPAHREAQNALVACQPARPVAVPTMPRNMPRAALSQYPRLAFLNVDVQMELNIVIVARTCELQAWPAADCVPVAPTSDHNSLMVWSWDNIRGCFIALRWRLLYPNFPPAPTNPLVPDFASPFNLVNFAPAHISRRHKRSSQVLLTTDPNEIVQCFSDGGLPVVPLDPELRRCEPEGYELVLKWEYIPPRAGAWNPYARSQTGCLCAVPWVFVEASRFLRRNGAHQTSPARGSEDQQAQQEQEEKLLQPANQGMHAEVQDQQHLQEETLQLASYSDDGAAPASQDPCQQQGQRLHAAERQEVNAVEHDQEIDVGTTRMVSNDHVLIDIPPPQEHAGDGVEREQPSQAWVRDSLVKFISKACRILMSPFLKGCRKMGRILHRLVHWAVRQVFV